MAAPLDNSNTLPSVVDSSAPASTDARHPPKETVRSAPATSNSQPEPSYWSQHEISRLVKKEGNNAMPWSNHSERQYSRMLDNLKIPRKEPFHHCNGRNFEQSYVVEQRRIVVGPADDEYESCDLQSIQDCGGWTDEQVERITSGKGTERFPEETFEDSSQELNPASKVLICNPTNRISQWETSEIDEKTIDWLNERMLQCKEGDKPRIQFARHVVKPWMDRGRLFASHWQHSEELPSVMGKIASSKKSGATINDAGTSKEENTDQGTAEPVTAVGTQASEV